MCRQLHVQMAQYDVASSSDSLSPPSLSPANSLSESVSHCVLQHGKQHAAPRRQATDTVAVAVAAADTDTTAEHQIQIHFDWENRETIT